MSDDRLPLDLFVCPECGADDLEPVDDLASLPLPYASAHGYRCSACQREYPIVDGVHVLWTDSLRNLHLGESSERNNLAEQVIGANIEVYDEIADDYGEHSDNLFNYHDTLLFLKALAVDRTKPNAGDLRVCVDVGCGPGVGLDAGASLHDLNVGVDVSLANLRHIEGKGYLAVLADSSNLPLKTDVIDMVTCFAALHHFPSAQEFAGESHRVLRAGGVLLTGADPNDALLDFGPVAQFVWDARKPVYRFLSRFTDRYYLHKNRDIQSVNDVAEHQRTLGGFSAEGLRQTLVEAGFSSPNVFYGLDPDGRKQAAVPEPKVGLLKVLSLQNPVKPANWMSLSTISLKCHDGAESVQQA